MKLTQDIIRKLIQEEMPGLFVEVSDPTLEQNAVTQISNLLVRLEAEGINAQQVLNKAKQAYDTSSESSAQLEGKLTAPEKEKREEVAQAMEEEDPNIDMSKKMAIATAQAKKNA